MNGQNPGNLENRFYVEMTESYEWRIIDRKGMYPSKSRGLSSVLAVVKDPVLAGIMCKTINDREANNVKNSTKQI
jgi:hypothetical protein